MKKFAAVCVLALAGLLRFSDAAEAQAQWNYTFVNNVGTATYPGNVVVNGTINGVTPGSLVIATTPISGGVTNQVLFDNAGILGEVTKANSSVFVSSGAGAPSWATTLPSGLTLPTPIVTGSFTATGLVTLADHASQAANTVIGATAIGSPSALAVPSCSAATSALTWTTGTGFGCNTIGTAPYMSVRLSSNQNITGTSLNKINFDTVELDSNSWWDATNHRYTPQLAGKYLVTATCGVYAISPTAINCSIYKTGVASKQNVINSAFVTGTTSIISTSGIISLNGTTDYIEADGSTNGTGAVFAGAAAPDVTWMQAQYIGP